MITSKQILSQICARDWFFSLDLKDAYFHIQIAPHHRRFLRFAFKGVAYQYSVLSLASRTFAKYMDALSSLRQMGIRILNYLDDWLILAQSEDEPLSHRSVLLCHLEYLELRVNFAKGTLSPSKLISFLGTVIDSARMSAVVTPERALAIQQVTATSSSSTCLVLWMPPCQGEPTPFRQSEQLFVCFGGRIKGSPFTKQRLSRWKIDAIMLAYFSLGQQCPMGVRAHLTRGITSSWALSSGVSIAESEAEPHRPHLPGFIIWKFRPYRPGSFLYNGLTLVI